ncbi:hypothetical protein RI129_007797 [Pyrocoelia pectoralis]|uniref:Uncharacterized protein n=1 Tax=Pyrocoelia pectoralis TaxID=417401 RepID=A0AAN7ZHB8_9COLE
MVVRLVKKTFENDFITVRHMFDRLMAKNCPLNLAIIDGDFNGFESILKTKEDSVLPLDGGGRSPFHLISSWWRFISKFTALDTLILCGKVECKIDYILNYTPIEYALLTKSFLLADVFCSRLKTLDKCVVSICEEYDIVLQFGWPFRNCDYQYLGLVCLICQVTKELSLEEQVFYHQIPDEFSFTPLHLASFCGECQVIRELLEQNADVNAYDKYGKTPLHWAAVKGHLNAVEILLSNSANVNLPDKNGMNVLHYLFMLNIERDAEIISILLEKNGDLNKKDKYGIPAFYYAFHCNRQKFIAHLPAIITNLTRYNLSLTDIDCREYGNLLHWAVSVGEEDTLKLFLDFGANVNVCKYCGRTQLHLRCENDFLEFII